MKTLCIVVSEVINVPSGSGCGWSNAWAKEEKRKKQRVRRVYARVLVSRARRPELCTLVPPSRGSEESMMGRRPLYLQWASSGRQ